MKHSGRGEMILLHRKRAASVEISENLGPLNKPIDLDLDCRSIVLRMSLVSVTL